MSYETANAKAITLFIDLPITYSVILNKSYCISAFSEKQVSCMLVSENTKNFLSERDFENTEFKRQLSFLQNAELDC